MITKQCSILSFHDGANACVLAEGHDRPHENCFGDLCDRYGWGQRHDVIEYLSRRYYPPYRRDKHGNPR